MRLVAIMILAFIGATLFLIVHLVQNFFVYPWHASCKIEWQIPQPCSQVSSSLINQMKAWEGDANCGSMSEACPKMPCGQECLYNYTSTETDGTVKGHHQTPVKRYTDNMVFMFASDNAKTCTVQASSSSSVWYAYLDFGTNYCNLRNLVDGSGLSKIDDFEEKTDDTVCTQYTSRDCSRF